MSSSPQLPLEEISTQMSGALSSNEVTQGCILWLADECETMSSFVAREEKDGIPVLNIRTGQTANSGMFGHPIVVLSRPYCNPNVIYFHQMTSFAGKTLSERFAGRKASFRQQTFCPVDPAPQHPQCTGPTGRYKTLTLEKGASLEKASYVNVREVYRMDWRDAQPYWGADPNIRKIWKLDAASVASLARLTAANAGFKADLQFTSHPTVPFRGQAKLMNTICSPSLPWDARTIPQAMTTRHLIPGAPSNCSNRYATLAVHMQSLCQFNRTLVPTCSRNGRVQYSNPDPVLLAMLPAF